MKYLSAVLSALMLFGISNAGAFDVKKGQWIGYLEKKGVIDEVISFYVNDLKNFKGYSFTSSGALLRVTGNVTDGNQITLIRRGRNFFDEASGRISGRPVRFAAKLDKVKFDGFRRGSELKVAGAYEGFNSFGNTVLMVILPNQEVTMVFKGEDFEATLTGRTHGRFFTVTTEDGSLRVKVTVSGNGQKFRGEGRNGGQAFRVFGETLPETPEDLSKN